MRIAVDENKIVDREGNYTIQAKKLKGGKNTNPIIISGPDGKVIRFDGNYYLKARKKQSSAFPSEFEMSFSFRLNTLPSKMKIKYASLLSPTCSWSSYSGFYLMLDKKKDALIFCSGDGHKRISARFSLKKLDLKKWHKLKLAYKKESVIISIDSKTVIKKKTGKLDWSKCDGFNIGCFEGQLDNFLFSSRISPQSWQLKDSFRIKSSSREKICLNGIWLYNSSNDDGIPTTNWKTLLVPCNGKFKGWFKREFKVPKGWENRRIFINFEQINPLGEIYINGKKAAVIPQWYDGRIDISSLVNFQGYNSVSVRVSTLRPSGEDLTYLGADEVVKRKALPLRKAGLVQNVWLQSIPANAIAVDSPQIITSVKNRKLSLAIDLETQISKFHVSAKIYHKGKLVKEFPQTPAQITKRKTLATVSWKWNGAKLWSPDTPFLYDAEITLINEGKKDQLLPIRFGFREIEVSKGDFYFNGHKIHIRADHSSFIKYFDASAAKALDHYHKFKKLGFNALMLGNNYYWKKAFSIGDYETMLNYMDKDGMLVFLAGFPVNEFYKKWEKYPETRKHWQAVMKNFIRRYRNHPCVIGWNLNWNLCSTYWSLNPTFAGLKYKSKREPLPNKFLQREIAVKSEKLVKQYDSTRLIMEHAGGSTSLIHTANCYYNWMPLQEKEDSISRWHSKKINCNAKNFSPLFWVEYAYSPLFFSYCKTRNGCSSDPVTECFLPEYGAIYLGDKAYSYDYNRSGKFISTFGKRRQHTRYLQKSQIMRELVRLFYKYNLRSYRTYGISGISPNGIKWDIAVLPSVKDSGKCKTIKCQNSDIKSPGHKFDSIRIFPNKKIPETFEKYHQKYLAYIGGPENNFSSKDHAFFNNETVKKSIIIINDSYKPINANASISLIDNNSKILHKRTYSLNIKPGEKVFQPVKFNLPKNSKRTEYILSLKVKIIDGKVLNDNFALEAYPKLAMPRLNEKIVLYDKTGKTTKLLKRAKVNFTKYSSIADLKNCKLLIIGCNALDESLVRKFRKIDISARNRQGLNILFFEQNEISREVKLTKRGKQAYKNNQLPKTVSLALLGIRSNTISARNVFVRAPAHPVLKGLKSKDFFNWRGTSSQLLPYPEPNVESDNDYPARPWKWGNKGIVASTVIEKPHRGSFKVILDCGFDLMNTPLVEFYSGKGKTIFCQLDVTDRYGKDPAATKIVNNLLDYCSSSTASHAKKLAFLGDQRTKNSVKKLGFTFTTDQTQVDIIVTGNYNGPTQKLMDFARKGGIVFCLPQTAKFYKNLPFIDARSTMKMYMSLKIKNCSLLSGLGNSDFYWKEFISTPVFSIPGSCTTPQVICSHKYGKGKFIFCQFSPEMFNSENEYTRSGGKENGFLKSQRILSCLLTNIGAVSSINVFAGMTNKVKDIDLCGVWKFKIDPDEIGLKEGWHKTNRPSATWEKLNVPGIWENQGIKQVNSKYDANSSRQYNGVAWYKKEIFIPENWKNNGKILFQLGAIDDLDTTFFNGKEIGQTSKDTPNYWSAERIYKIPEKYIQFGKTNLISIRVVDLRGGGGIVKSPVKIAIEPKSSKSIYSYLGQERTWDPYSFRVW